MYKLLKKTHRKIKRWLAYYPPGALSADGWNLFETEFKKVAPIRFFIQNTVRYFYIHNIRNPLVDLKYWIIYRTTRKYHIINTGLPPRYYEFDTLMFHANFKILVDYVEVSLASQMYQDRKMDGNISWAEEHIPFYDTFVRFRSKEYGIKNLEWQSKLDDPSLPVHEQSPQQAKNAREILMLYKWWTEERPARKEIELPSFDNQGLGYSGPFSTNFNKNAKDYQLFKKLSKKRQTQQKKWEKEDDDMLLKLIKLRRHLWA